MTPYHTTSLKQPRVTIVGAGITGLACAYDLQKRLAKPAYGERESGALPPKLELLEASPRVGGVINTIERDGFVVDEGPDCFISTKPEALELAEELGLEERMIGTSSRFRRSFILFRGKPTPIPAGFFLLAPTSFKALAATPLLSWPGKLRAALDWFIPSRQRTEIGLDPDAQELPDECLSDFVTRRFGREVLDRIAQPMVAGIYTADPKKLSLAATFPQFLKMERDEGSVMRALIKQGKAKDKHAKRDAGTEGAKDAAGPRYGMFVSFDKGMGVLPETLKGQLQPGVLRTRCGIRQLIALPKGRWRLVDSEGAAHECHALALALPFSATAKLLREAKGDDPTLLGKLHALGEALEEIRYASSSIVTFAFKRDQIAHPLDGMGMVIPAIERREILAASFSHEKWAGRAPDGHVLIRAFIGGALQEHLAELPDAKQLEIARRELGAILGISGDPLFAMVSRWPSRMAQYEVGHLQRVARIRELERAIPTLTLAGNGFDGVGIPDCIRHGRHAATEIAEMLAR